LKILNQILPSVKFLIEDEESILKLSKLQEGYILSKYFPFRYKEIDVIPLWRYIRGVLDGYFCKN
jgi:hypothetical protein